MDDLITQAIVYGGISLAIVFMILSLGYVLSRFYRRCGADEALVRTGSGGNKVVIGGGVLVYPILHQLQRVSLRSVKLSVERSGRNALVTADKIKANVTTELYIKVEPVAEDVLSAARSFGDRNMDEHAIGDLIEGRLTDALRSVAANQTLIKWENEEEVRSMALAPGQQGMPHREEKHHRIPENQHQVKGKHPEALVPDFHRDPAHEVEEEQAFHQRHG